MKIPIWAAQNKQKLKGRQFDMPGLHVYIVFKFRLRPYSHETFWHTTLR